MTKHFPFTTLYLLLLFAAVIASWLVGLYGVGSVQSLLSGEGIRWWMRSALPAFASSPVGEMLLVLFTLGVVRRSCRAWSGRAFAVALAVFLLLVALVLWGVFSGNLLSATGHWAHSPLQKGWLPLLALLVGIPCFFYGLNRGLFHSGLQVQEMLGSEVARCASVFFAVFVASQLVAVLTYSGLPAASGINSRVFRYISLAIYWLPFLCGVFQVCKENKNNK